MSLLSSMTRMRTWNSSLGGYGAAEQLLHLGLRLLLRAAAFGHGHAVVGRAVGTGLLLALANQAAVLAGAGQQRVHQLLFVEDFDPRRLRQFRSLAVVEQPGDAIERTDHAAAVVGADLRVGSAVVELGEDGAALLLERAVDVDRSEEHTSELQSRENLVCC